MRLGKAAPSAITPAVLYKVILGAEEVTLIAVCNRSSADTTFRLWLLDAEGASTSGADYLFYNTEVCANKTIFIAFDNIRFSKGNILMCYSSSGTVSFQVFNGI